VDRAELERELAAAFAGTAAARRAVARQARDLADSGRFEADFGRPLTADLVVSNLEDAPDEYALLERWNWWLGSLELSQGGYREFRGRTDIE